MKIFDLPLFAAILPLAATLSLLPAPVRADSYKVVDLGSANFRNIVDVDNLGQVIIFNTSSLEYLTYADGLLVNTTSSLPSLTYDNGTPCSAPSGFNPAGKVVCNNGRIGFSSIFNPNSEPSGVYTGPISSLTLVLGNGNDPDAVLNSAGDFAWTDGSFDENWEAIDLTTTTPEPDSLLFVATGCLSLFCVARRKLS
jgi:hypothetical protein